MLFPSSWAHPSPRAFALLSLTFPLPRSRFPRGHLVVGNPSLRASDGRPSVHETRHLWAGLPGDFERYAGRELSELYQLLRVGDHPPLLSSLRLPAAVVGPPEALHVVLPTGLGPAVWQEPLSAQSANNRKLFRSQQLWYISSRFGNSQWWLLRVVKRFLRNNLLL